MASQGSENPARESARQRIRTPLILQMHATECGAACLGSVLAHFGRWVSLSELRDKCEVSRDGSSAAGLLRAARSYGLECSGKYLAPDKLRAMQMPLVLFWEFRHFVVLEGFDSESWYLNDPSFGRRRISSEDFQRSFSGVALAFKVGPDFRPGGNRPGILKRLRGWLGKSRDLLAGAFACGLLLALLALLVPASLGAFLDRILDGRESQGVVLASVMLLAGIMAYCLALLKQQLLGKLAVRMSIVMSNRLISGLLRLPVEFFSHRMVGDLTQRILSIDQIAKDLTGRFLALLIEVSMSLVLLAAMAFIDGTLTLIVLGLAALYAGLSHAILRLGAERMYSLRRERGLLVGIGLQMLSHADNLRMIGADDRMYSRWSGQQSLELNMRQRASELDHLGSALSGLAAAMVSVAILAFGAIRVMSGDITLGAWVGFYVLAAMFFAPVGRFVALANRRQSLETDMHRLGDLAEAVAEVVPAPLGRDPRRGEDSISTFNGRLQLAGQVELRNITFGYNRNKPPLIKDFNLRIRPGQRVAIVGPSGSGKSTISRLVAGLNEPWAGEILFDGKPRREIPAEVLSRSISMVDQDAVLFSASVRENITLWNPAIPDETIIAAARDACMHEEILRRPGGYSARVEEGGVNFSGGQRQRLEIARSLVGNPAIIILDEATSALDAATEEFVDDALRRRGATCLIIAHRLSTVRDCDEIIVLNKGVEVQRGTHDSLIADPDGAYCKLVKASSQ